MKKTTIFLLIFLIILTAFSGCTDDYEEGDMTKAYEMYIKIGDKILTAEMIDNSATQKLKSMLKQSDIELDMQDYANMEKVGRLSESLPADDKYINTQAGDIVLYQGNQFVIYYDTNSWSLTRLGKIKDITAQELKSILGKGDIKIVLSLKNN